MLCIAFKTFNNTIRFKLEIFRPENQFIKRLKIK